MKHHYFTLWKVLMLFLSMCFVFGCNKYGLDPIQDKSESNILATNNINLKKETLSVKRSRELMENFSKLLRNAVKDDETIRLFLKKEALKKFNKDYDILYGLIKDNIVANNLTFRQMLLKYVKDEQELLEYEQNLPLLTIYIPNLPNFSADNWNTSSEIPGVSTGVLDANRLVTYYLKDGKQEQKTVDLVPGFPLLVVKTNERVILSEQSGKKNLPTVSKTSLNGNNYVFLSESFNGQSGKTVNKPIVGGGVTTNSTCVNCSLDSKVSTAYDLWSQHGNNIWQRDYIYYTISPNSPNGQLDTRYKETITALKFKTGKAAYEKISDQAEDPYAVWDPNSGGPTAAWTEGSFEFKVTALINNTQGAGATIENLFPVDASKLFHLHYQYQGDGYYALSITPIQCDLNEDIAAWDIKNNGVAWKITLAEVDPSGTDTKSYTITSQFATNFGIDLSKIGLKFGTTATTTSQSVYSLIIQVGDDQLGEDIAYFYDPVVTHWDMIPNVGQSFTFKDLDVGWALLTLQPKKQY